VDTHTLGYHAGDVHRFSYRAGSETYGAQDTNGDINAAAALLRKRLTALRAANPGIPVDVIAHSMGGLVARAAVATAPDLGVAMVITLGTPHQGADLATAAAVTSLSSSGRAVLGVSRAAGVDAGAVAVTEMAEHSPFLRDLDRRRWPPSTRVVSIAARGDVVVPNIRSRLAGADNTVVALDGLNPFAHHDRLPGSPQAEVEIARAVGGQRTTCRSFRVWLADELQGRQISVLEDELGLAVATGGAWVDAQVRTLLRDRR
jgi:pimeloyl-ACP methyl ester carboxylesterase